VNPQFTMNRPVAMMSVPRASRSLPVSPASMHPRLVIQIAACSVPAMTLASVGQYVPGAYVFFLCLGSMLAYHALARRPIDAMAVAVGTIPCMMLLRGLFFYNSIQAVFAGCLILALSSHTERARFLKNTPLVYFVAVSLLYWLTSVFLTGDYTANSRMIEFALATATVYILAGHRSYLASAILGIVVSALAMAGALLSQSTPGRLGALAVSSEITVGNPIAIGLSASLGYLLTIADRGRWLLLHHHLVRRVALNLLAGAVLILSTSRGSWLVTLIGLVIILFLNRSGRSTLLACVVVLVVLIAVILQTDRGPMIQHYYDNALNDDRSLDKRTTGRADQWQSFPRVFNDSPLWGFGPGSGKVVSLRYTKEGKPWHSLYLLIGAETGLIGLSALGLLLAVLMVRAYRHLRTCGESVPLLGILCLMIIGVSVSGTDAISGVFLGLAFVGGDLSCMRIIRDASSVSTPLARDTLAWKKEFSNRAARR
jgi:O-antigen ligase